MVDAHVCQTEVSRVNVVEKDFVDFVFVPEHEKDRHFKVELHLNDFIKTEELSKNVHGGRIVKDKKVNDKDLIQLEVLHSVCNSVCVTISVKAVVNVVISSHVIENRDVLISVRSSCMIGSVCISKSALSIGVYVVAMAVVMFDVIYQKSYHFSAVYVNQVIKVFISIMNFCFGLENQSVKNNPFSVDFVGAEHVIADHYCSHGSIAVEHNSNCSINHVSGLRMVCNGSERCCLGNYWDAINLIFAFNAT